MKLSRERINLISNQILEDLVGQAEIDFKYPRNEVRLQVVEILRVEMLKEEQIEEVARQRVTSLARDIPEGSDEWNVLYDKAYREESEKQRKVK
jgi:hypothetical protein